MNSSQEVFETLKQLWENFEENHNGTTKRQKKDARGNIGEIKKLVTEYRKLSVAENK